uniref:Uncharacterized protein n=1 Tax=Arundo donax TaxID=35708 RepID=A0A0A8ZHZ7_ARUDO
MCAGEGREAWADLQGGSAGTLGSVKVTVCGSAEVAMRAGGGAMVFGHAGAGMEASGAWLWGDACGGGARRQGGTGCSHGGACDIVGRLRRDHNHIWSRKENKRWLSDQADSRQ